MALIIILIFMGGTYSLSTRSTKPVRQLELIAVWGTLCLIAVSVLSGTNPALSLPIAAVVAAPLWYLTLSASEQQARSEARDTLNLWRHWRATTGSHALSTAEHGDQSPGRTPLSTRLDYYFGEGDLLEEIELTRLPQEDGEPLPGALGKLELAPTEKSPYQRGRRV